MAAAASDLAARAQRLNARRVETFGGSELELAATDRLRTALACVPRDIVQVGGLLLLGANPQAGLKPETEVGDVFTLFRPVAEPDAATGHFTPAPPDAIPGLLDDPRFQRDVGELYRYYRNTRLLQLRVTASRLLAVFTTGERLTDIRVLRWRLAPGEPPEYLDAKGERDHVFPPQQDVTWTETGRDDHVPGEHPHVRIPGSASESTAGVTAGITGGRLTLTAGETVHSEPVDEPLQALADARIAYARVGPLVLLRVLPYNETQQRYFVCNTRTSDIVRLDAIGQACLTLPDDQGIIVPGAYYLAAAPAGHAARTFDTDVEALEFERALHAPGGEDVLYVFHARAEGRYLLLPYNLIRKEVAAPLTCHGYALFDDGTLAVCRADAAGEPARVHRVQLWRTPFESEAHAAVRPPGTGPLARIGNADVVRGISEALTVARMARELEPARAVFEAVAAACDRFTDQFPWLSMPGLEGLHEPVAVLRETAERVVEEHERVVAEREEAARVLAEADAEATALIRRARGEAPKSADEWVALLTELRQAQGRAESLRETRAIDREALAAMGERLAEALAAAGRRAVTFLAREDAFDATHAAIAGLAERAGEARTAAALEPLAEEAEAHGESLRAVTDVVGGLDIADAEVRTGLLERLGEVMAALNRARAVLDGRRRELLESEGRAEFAAEFALLGQAVTGALAAATTPEECDEQLGRLLLQLENLEARFGHFDDFLARLAEQREEIYETFAARKQARLDERERQAERLAESAERILRTVSRRATSLGGLDEVNAYFATDPLVARVTATAGELRELGATVRADELEGRLKAIRQEAGRALRDRMDLIGADGTLRLGRHRFTVTSQPFDLTLVPHDGGLSLAVTGTDYRAPVTDPAFAGTRPFWDQPLPSESPEVYRAEHLAASMLAAGQTGGDLAAAARRAAEAAYDEGYDRGVHDHDAALILAAVLRLREAAGLLRYPPHVRAAAQLFWAHGTTASERAALSVRAQSLARARETFGAEAALAELAGELATAAGEFLSGAVPDAAPGGRAAAAVGGYLVEELAASRPAFAVSPAARALLDDFGAALGTAGAKEFAQDLAALGEGPAALAARWQLAHAWLGAFAASAGRETTELPEAVAVELCRGELAHRVIDAPLCEEVTGLLGVHPRIDGGRLTIRLDEFLSRTEEFRTERVPAHRAYVRQRNALLEAERRRLRLDAFRPRVMPAFVRNRLLDEVYLPLIGDNFAKQLGAAGQEQRTDRQGLLLLLSPPGYGKTTLMEYLAARLGLVFVKVDGPSLGHGTTSLDPAAAPDAAARREVEKINFGLEMGNNVLLYLDDIQHTSPELLQRFIPLCDAQRRVDGVRVADGEPVTHDLRGKRFAVCMAGNPFTESGTRFRVPDMLANRADVWNLGEVLTGREELFALSHVENALTSNPVLAPLAGRERRDIELLTRLAGGDTSVTADQLAHPYPPAELERVVSVLRGLLRVRETALRVNAAYIASATQADAHRTEPPFLLQGSYRDTSRMAERLVPVMNEEEIEAVIDDHYQAEAQTLTTGAEANLLKLAELRGRLTPEQAARWEEIKQTYRREVRDAAATPAESFSEVFR
ncbi:DNA repair ATPase [Streptomyces sp. 7-21]|uniref:DNA repair ATPase n=1 Tax=Streptomyces sp. 7-21 TaxID=2802283 RepID=UPI00191EFCEA|nr:DNA repair ATPase [Streptomyces sp. 7-21]MBL1067719.1 DNA repair ATPase [Streptomyces sp. 7-21]